MPLCVGLCLVVGFVGYMSMFLCGTVKGHEANSEEGK